MSGSLVYVPGVVTFDYTRWIEAYPQFAVTVPTATQGQMYFTLAGGSGDPNLPGGYLDNTPNSPIQDSSVGGQREMLLWLVTAHIAQLFAGSTGNAATGAVGRVSAASEGSVSVSLDLPAATSSLEGWFAQTQYGLMFWGLTEQYRSFRPNPYGQQFNQVGQLPNVPGFLPYTAVLRAYGFF